MTKKNKEDQDRAAGGEHMRKVKLKNGQEATASVSVQTHPNGYQKWGYLRFKTGGSTEQFYIGKVSADTLDESLAIGWAMVREKSVLERYGWSWVIPSAKNKSRQTATKVSVQKKN